MWHAVHEAMRMIREVPCEHHVGMCRCPYERYEFYWRPDSRRPFKPWVMALLACTSTLEGAIMMQAGIMYHIEATRLNRANSYNCMTCDENSADFGAEDVNLKSHAAHRQHYVYIALKPLSPEVAVTAESARGSGSYG